MGWTEGHEARSREIDELADYYSNRREQGRGGLNEEGDSGRGAGAIRRGLHSKTLLQGWNSSI